jgi:hypothetical protein
MSPISTFAGARIRTPPIVKSAIRLALLTQPRLVRKSSYSFVWELAMKQCDGSRLYIVQYQYRGCSPECLYFSIRMT